MTLTILLLLALMAERIDRIATQQLTGTVRIGDGDSLTLDGERIRLRGIDAPEYKQQCSRDGQFYPCGERARRALVELIGNHPVTCEGWERDRYGRLLARCEAGGRDLGRAMVEAGWAVSYGDYADAEAEARRAGRGLWAGTFEAPRNWRAAQQENTDEAPHDWLGLLVNFLRQLLWRAIG